MTAATTTIDSVTDDSFRAEVLEADRAVLVDFTAAWYPPCRTAIVTSPPDAKPPPNLAKLVSRLR